jgi:hypothetical protein
MVIIFQFIVNLDRILFKFDWHGIWCFLNWNLLFVRSILVLSIGNLIWGSSSLPFWRWLLVVLRFLIFSLN